MAERVSPADLSWILRLTNDFSNPARVGGGEEDWPYPDIAAIGEPPSSAFGMTTHELVDLADRLYAVFAADSDAERFAKLDSLLYEGRPIPRIEYERLPVVTWEVSEKARATQVACALSLVDLFVANGMETHVGTCHADHCVDVFVDRSKARTRKYCSQKCQSRTKVAAFRARQRQ